MTVHVRYEHQCPGCRAHYIPYAPGVPCPQCERPSQESFDFVPQAAASLRFNLRTYGSYLPPAWYVGSLGDHCLRLLFAAFESFRTRADVSESFAACVERKLSAMDWGEQGYLRGHMRDIALQVHSAMSESRHGC